MRTRDEQLEEIFDLCRDSGVIGSYFVAKEIMTEIEQRVRAEIARDSERLDWLVGTVQEIGRVSNRPTQWVLEFPTPLRSLDRDALRQAIDAAREVG